MLSNIHILPLNLFGRGRTNNPVSGHGKSNDHGSLKPIIPFLKRSILN